MNDDFNPYHQWLGIPEKKCPPTHYELLGLSLDEEDHGVIRTAAQRQRTHVEQFTVGPHPAHVTQILYQIDEAELTLLNSELRRNYDRQVDLFKKRRKRRQFDPTVAPPSSSLPMAGGPTVGEESGLFRQFFGIVSILLVAFMIMAAFSFGLPWQNVVFNNDNGGDNADPVGKRVKAPKIAKPVARNDNNVEVDVAHQEPETEIENNDDIAAATIDATITVIDVPGRSLTISRKTKTSILDVSRKAQIIIAGKEAALDSLVPNQMASITFDPNFDVITKIEVAADSGAASAPDAGLGVTDDESLATVDVTISAIDVAGREMTITRNSRTTVFDISRKAEVKVDGKAASLESLKPGQSASITFDPEYDIVVSVEAAATKNGSSPAPTTTATDKPSNAEDDNLATIDATITAIDAAGRSITVSRKSKTITFDVSRKVEVIFEGKTATLISLKPGQNVSITFNTEFDVVVKIEVASSDSPTEQKN